MDRKRSVSLIAIAVYFIVEALFDLYRFFIFFQSGEITNSHFITLLIAIGFMLSGVGLFLQKGWGRNFALCFNFIILFNGIRNILSYFVIDNTISFVIKGLVSISIAILIFLYLLSKNVKERFTKSPVSLFILGFFLTMHGITQHTGYALIDYFWLAMAIVGMSISCIGAKQLRNKQ